MKTLTSFFGLLMLLGLVSPMTFAAKCWIIAEGQDATTTVAARQGNLPQELVGAKSAIEAAESYEEFASYEDQPHVAAEGAEERESSLQAGLKRADLDLTKYLKKNPGDVSALLLQVRLDEIKGQIFAISMSSQQGVSRPGMPDPERDPLRTLSGILEKDPDNAEACYRVARFWGMMRIRLGVKNPLVQQADFRRAVHFANKAVQKAPDNVEYRGYLAMYLSAQGKNTEALEALKPLLNSQDPRHRLLFDETKISTPEGSAFDTDNVEQTLPVARDEHLDFPALRIRAYLYPGPMSKVAEFYQRTWKEFKLQKIPSTSNQFALFRWQDEKLEFSAEPVSEETFKKAPFWIAVSEMQDLTPEIKKRLFWKELLGDNPSKVVCFIIMFNRRPS